MKLQRPAPTLSRFISHYWLSRDNTDTVHPVLPDGSIDVVFELGRTARSRAYGAATRRTTCTVLPGYHYLGISFRPGQARRFLKIPAHRLADNHIEIAHLAALSAESLADIIASDKVFQQLETVLLNWLARHPISLEPVDLALDVIDRNNGRVRIEWLAAELGISRRQLERYFLNGVGIPPKRYARIRRWQYTLALLHARPGASLAMIALTAGYADQSHMNRDFRELARLSPRTVTDVAFVQDLSLPSCYPVSEKIQKLAREI